MHARRKLFTKRDQDSRFRTDEGIVYDRGGRGVAAPGTRKVNTLKRRDCREEERTMGRTEGQRCYRIMTEFSVLAPMIVACRAGGMLRRRGQGFNTLRTYSFRSVKQKKNFLCRVCALHIFLSGLGCPRFQLRVLMRMYRYGLERYVS